MGAGDCVGFDWDACFGIDMNEIKAKMSDLFKDGENFKFKEVDYSSKKMQKVIAAVKKEQERIRKSTELPPLSDSFWHTPFNI